MKNMVIYSVGDERPSPLERVAVYSLLFAFCVFAWWAILQIIVDCFK